MAGILRGEIRWADLNPVNGVSKWGQAYLINYSALPILSQGLFYHSN